MSVFDYISSRTNFLKRFPRMHLPLQIVVCTATFAFALPLAISLFPQFSKVNVYSTHFSKFKFQIAHCIVIVKDFVGGQKFVSKAALTEF